MILMIMVIILDLTISLIQKIEIVNKKAHIQSQQRTNNQQ